MPCPNLPLAPLSSRPAGGRPAPSLTRRSFLSAAGGGLAALAAACGTVAPGSEAAHAGPPDSSADRAPASTVTLAGAFPGKLLYVGDANVWVWEKGEAKRLTNDRISRQPAWSPDGKRIAHVKIDVSSSELWVMDADSANSRQLTNNYSEALAKNNWAFRPAWLPDQSRILYLTDQTTSDLMLWQASPDGKIRRPLITVPDLEGGLDMPSVSPDGKRVALITYRNAGARSQVWLFTLATGQGHQLTEVPEGAYDPAWSPDGTRIAYVARNKGKHDLWLVAADGTNPQQVTQIGACRAPCWSPDGKLLAFVAGESGGMDVWAINAPVPAETTKPADTAAARQLTRGAQVDGVSGLSWTR